MDKELCSGETVRNTMGSLETTNLMAKAPSIVNFIIILVNLEMTKDMAQALLLILMVNATRVIGKMTNYMAKASILGLMDKFMRVIGKITNNMGMAL